MYSLINEFVTLDEDEKRRKELEEGCPVCRCEKTLVHNETGTMKLEKCGKVYLLEARQDMRSVMDLLAKRPVKYGGWFGVEIDYCPHCGRKLRRVE